MKTHLLLILLLSQNVLSASNQRPDTTMPQIQTPGLSVQISESNGTMVLRYELQTAGLVTLTLEDTSENMSLTLYPGWHEAGVYEKTLGTTALSEGQYSASLLVNGQQTFILFKIGSPKS